MSEPPVSWMVNNWRLKLLSLVLAVGLVGAVAFSQNPPVFDTAAVRVKFADQPQDLVVVDPPTTIDVPVAGLRDTVTKYKNTAAGVTINLANAKPGPNQVFAVTPRTDVPGVTVRSRVGPIRLTLEPQETRQLDIEIRTKASPGIAVIPEKTYAICGNSNDRCQVSVTAASSVVDVLKAYVDYDVPLTSANTVISPNEPVKFEANGHPINDLPNDVKSLPHATFTPPTVTVQVATRGGTMTRTVGVAVRTTGTQACGYAITASDVQPSPLVTITGPVDQVSKLTSLPIEPVDIAGLTGTTIVNRRVQTPSQVSAEPAMVRVTVVISQAFNCAAATAAGLVSPGPAPSPSR
ncbi:MAG TPA: hypothetical protein VKF14_04865 [Candidatus Dormibacteraeota bacterium]|nr:hypothetical protein [Candidatus Dormibacteraeota bacterium]